MSTKLKKRHKRQQSKMLQKDTQTIFSFAYHVMRACGLQEISVIKHTYPDIGMTDYDMITVPSIDDMPADLILLHESICYYMEYKDLVRLNIDFAYDRVKIRETQAHDNSPVLPLNCLTCNAINQIIR
ncbi:MAG: hypothetical protein IJH37_07745 [Clostridia bacterium]|nr:hypothetical protein [Clostridia bacterium]